MHGNEGVRTNLDERRIHFTAHAFPDARHHPDRRDILLSLRLPARLARAPAVRFVEKVLLEERVVEECLEDGGEEACLGEVKERADR